MKRIPLAALAALSPSLLQAHSTTAVPHMHPHGSESLLALTASAVLGLVLLAVLWRKHR